MCKLSYQVFTLPVDLSRAVSVRNWPSCPDRNHTRSYAESV